MEKIIINVYHYEDDDGYKVYDEECMREEFEYQLTQLPVLNQ